MTSSSSLNILALSVFRDQCPSVGSSMQALVLSSSSSSLLPAESLLPNEDIAAALQLAALPPAQLEQLNSRNTLSANREREKKRKRRQQAVAEEEQPRQLVILRGRECLPPSHSSSSSSQSLPTATTSTSTKTLTGLFPYVHGWKKFTNVEDYWVKGGILDRFHGGYIRRCIVALSVCFLRFGSMIARRWIVNNPDSYACRNSLQLSTIDWLKKNTWKHVYSSSFHVLARGLEYLPLDIILNTGLVWLRADVLETCGPVKPSRAQLQLWMEQFVTRILPWFVRFFFLHDASPEKCLVTKKTIDDVFPQLEFTWVKKASIHPINTYATMHLTYPHTKNISKETIAIPVLGVRQNEWLVEEERQLMEGGHEQQSLQTQKKTKKYKKQKTNREDDNNNSVVQTRSGARIHLLTKEIRQHQQQCWFEESTATPNLGLFIPSLRSSVSLFQQLIAASTGSNSGSDAGILPFLTGKKMLTVFRPKQRVMVENPFSKQLLCSAEKEVQWFSLLEEAATAADASDATEEEEEDRWIPYTTMAEAEGTIISCRIRALYCFCSKHAMPLLKRCTIFIPIYGYLPDQQVDAKGIDLCFLDECGGCGGGGGDSTPRPCFIRFFDSCRLNGIEAQETTTLQHYLYREKEWEMMVTPVYRHCCVLKNNQASVFQFQAELLQLPENHLLFSSKPIGHFIYKDSSRSWHKLKTPKHV